MKDKIISVLKSTFPKYEITHMHNLVVVGNKKTTGAVPRSGATDIQPLLEVTIITSTPLGPTFDIGTRIPAPQHATMLKEIRKSLIKANIIDPLGCWVE